MKISELPKVTTVTDGAVVPIVQGGVTSGVEKSVFDTSILSKIEAGDNINIAEQPNGTIKIGALVPIVDSAMSGTSTNSVQNKEVKRYADTKVSHRRFNIQALKTAGLTVNNIDTLSLLDVQLMVGFYAGKAKVSYQANPMTYEFIPGALASSLPKVVIQDDGSPLNGYGSCELNIDAMFLMSSGTYMGIPLENLLTACTDAGITYELGTCEYGPAPVIDGYSYKNYAYGIKMFACTEAQISTLSEFASMISGFNSVDILFLDPLDETAEEVIA